MSTEEVGQGLAELIEGAEVSVSGGGNWARPTVDVPASSWQSAAFAARDQLDCDFFDWLSAVDELDGYQVIAHVWSTSQRHGLLIRTKLGLAEPSLDSLAPAYPGAVWHERETCEMFGIGFPDQLEPLLLPPEFEGHPLRKSFVLASRVAKPWPGAREPGESHDSTAPKRTTMRPPGVPAPGEWGPAAQ